MPVSPSQPEVNTAVADLGPFIVREQVELVPLQSPSQWLKENCTRAVLALSVTEVPQR